MRKSYIVGVAFAASLVTANANAEVMVGVDAGWAKVDVLDDTGAEVGVFGRFMSGGIGLHIGYAQSRAEDSVTVGDIMAEVEVENIIDVLLAFRTEPSSSGTHGLFMFGYSRAEVDGSGTRDGTPFSESDSVDGWKLAAGIERSISENAVFSVLAHYADYGDIDALGIDIDAEDSFGVRAGIAYRF